ncbi:hypothetical protein [Streptosporangium amethystogenes]|uniref:hypothetical protein n=1 Tax=Streptosporangium amethystogenes TaxID=2002 RepID=UPI0012F8D36C|nr:hypothetical protein [Streptosporangium amethystogenes]
MNEFSIGVVSMRFRLANLNLGSQWEDEGLVFARGSHKLMNYQTSGGPLPPERTSRLFKVRIARHELPDVTPINTLELQQGLQLAGWPRLS